MSKDARGRTIDYLRISVTDRCNLRCIYCMPENGIQAKDHEEILTLEEITRFAREAARYGITHIRLTGGEPLVRLGISDLIRDLHAIEGITDISLTTNGILLARYAEELKEAGLDRVNISLDTLDPETYHTLTRRGSLEDVFKGIDAAFEAGLRPIKLNAVGVREFMKDPFEFAQLSVDRPLHVRFIEYMPIGHSFGAEGHGWTAEDSISSEELFETINSEAQKRGIKPLVALDKDQAPFGAGPASYYAFEGAQGTVGFISPMSRHFCASCNRLRLTSDGKLRPCLFSDTEIDVRTALRAHNEMGVRAALAEALRLKPEDHSAYTSTEKDMAMIGG